jgi:hypothetical protein
VLGRRLNAIGHAAVVGLVEIQCQYLIFGVARGQLERQDSLTQLALQCSLLGQRGSIEVAILDSDRRLA